MLRNQHTVANVQLLEGNHCRPISCLVSSSDKRGGGRCITYDRVGLLRTRDGAVECATLSVLTRARYSSASCLTGSGLASTAHLASKGRTPSETQATHPPQPMQYFPIHNPWLCTCSAQRAGTRTHTSSRGTALLPRRYLCAQHRRRSCRLA
jgi:hypothetical protein